MKRQLPGLSEAVGESQPTIPDGVFLVRVEHAQHRWQAQKPFYVLRLSVLEPKPFTGHPIVSRLYCTSKAMWKLGWFLREAGDFVAFTDIETVPEAAVQWAHNLQHQDLCTVCGSVA